MPAEWVDEVRLVEVQCEQLALQRDAAIQIILHLLGGSSKDEIKSWTPKLKAALAEFTIEMNTHIGFPLSVLEGGPAEADTKVHRAFIEAARNFYKKLDAKEDPGPAKALLDGLSNLRSDCMGVYLMGRVNVESSIAAMELDRFVAGFGREEE